MLAFNLEAGQSGPSGDHLCLLDTPDVRLRLAAMAAMASTLAREVNQPLSVATSYLHASANLLRKRGEDFEDVLGMIERASQETLKAGEIIRRMRNFVMTGRINGRRENLGTMIETVVDSLTCPDRSGIEIKIGVKPDARFVLADRIQLEQVLSSILGNACEALVGLDVRRITILTVRIGGEVLVQVRDSGPAMSDDELDEKFAPSFTLPQDGAGLCLPICQAIVGAHGGYVWAERPADGGNLVSLSLPAAH
ncbi:MAG: sensor histidine kinase [Allosphingosinicella sp.]